MSRVIAITGTLVALIASPVMAEDELDVTLGVVSSPEALPDAVTRVLALPDAASETGVANSAKGLTRANESRHKGWEHGKAMAERGKAKSKKPDGPPGRP